MAADAPLLIDTGPVCGDRADMTKRSLIPTSAPDGALMAHAGRHARNAVATAFEMVGGVGRLSEWADENYSDFITKLFPKIIGRELEVGASEGVERLLSRLDALDEDILDGEFEVLDNDALADQSDRD